MGAIADIDCLGYLLADHSLELLCYYYTIVQALRISPIGILCLRDCSISTSTSARGG